MIISLLLCSILFSILLGFSLPLLISLLFLSLLILDEVLELKLMFLSSKRKIILMESLMEKSWKENPSDYLCLLAFDFLLILFFLQKQVLYHFHL